MNYPELLTLLQSKDHRQVREGLEEFISERGDVTAKEFKYTRDTLVCAEGRLKEACERGDSPEVTLAHAKALLGFLPVPSTQEVHVEEENEEDNQGESAKVKELDENQEPTNQGNEDDEQSN